VYKLNVNISTENASIQDYNVIYALRSGKKVDHSDQYSLNDMHTTPASLSGGGLAIVAPRR
jgi:hypothetical protein